MIYYVNILATFNKKNNFKKARVIFHDFPTIAKALQINKITDTNMIKRAMTGVVIVNRLKINRLITQEPKVNEYEFIAIFDDTITVHDSIMNIYDYTDGRLVDRNYVLMKLDNNYITLHPTKNSTKLSCGSVEIIPADMEGLPITRSVRNKKFSGLYKYYVGKDESYGQYIPVKEINHWQLTNLFVIKRRLNSDIYNMEQELKKLRMNSEIIQATIDNRE